MTATIIISICTSAIVFVLTECIKEVLFTPYNEYKRVKAKITFLIVLNSNVYANPFKLDSSNNANSMYKRATDQTREAAAELYSIIEKRYKMNLFIPDSKKLKEAARQLIGLSNSLHFREDPSAVIESNSKRILQILELLKIQGYTPEPQCK